MLIKLFSVAIASLAVIHLSAIQKEEIVLLEEFISPAWEQYDCHSSSLVELDNGEILALWKGGMGDGKSNFDIKSKGGIWQIRFDGRNWGTVKLSHFEEEMMIWNPVLGKLKTGELLLFYRAGEAPWNASAFVKRSKDGGLHWSIPELLPAGIIGPSKNKPVVLDDGTMVCPSSMQTGSPDGDYPATAVWIDITQDGGKTWRKSGPLTIPERPFGVIEPALFFDADGHLRIMCRDRLHRHGGKEGMIWMAVSKDMGNSWSKLEKITLPNPDSAFDVADLGKGHLVLIYNDSPTKRYPLSVAVSKDGGNSWEKKCDLEERTGEFPAVIQTADGLIHVTYAYEIESGQRRIKHAVIDPSKLFSDR